MDEWRIVIGSESSRVMHMRCEASTYAWNICVGCLKPIPVNLLFQRTLLNGEEPFDKTNEYPYLKS